MCVCVCVCIMYVCMYVCMYNSNNNNKALPNSYSHQLIIMDKAVLKLKIHLHDPLCRFVSLVLQHLEHLRGEHVL